MIFPNTGGGRPFVRIDGRSGGFSLSTLDGDPEIFEMTGRLLDLDLASAAQGWLKISKHQMKMYLLRSSIPPSFRQSFVMMCVINVIFSQRAS